ncbi:MAG TPA: hypothetical protein VNL18_11820, partial [Gemmatimonadales bacterium]|nr:hypothetical protein [Gemmatimonadales bacterium]
MQTPRKSEVTAGALSALIPGAGSFYAKAPNHGVLHLGIHLIAVAGWYVTEEQRTQTVTWAFLGNTFQSQRTVTVCSTDCWVFRTAAI